MIKTARLLTAAFLFMAILAPSLYGQAQATEPTPVSASILAGLYISNSGDLHFGEMLSPVSAGTVIVAQNATSTTGGVTLLTPPTARSATFVVGSTNNGKPQFWIELPATITIASITDPTDTMTVTAVTANVNAECIGSRPKNSGQCPKTDFVLYVGGTLGVAANQPGGAYNGTFTVTVNAF